MPHYEFECTKCKEAYDTLVPYDKTGKYKDVKCPGCGSKRKTRIFSSCNFMFANPEGTKAWISDNSGHDYRFKHNLPKVIAERKAAEEKSHMGTGNEIYNQINDIDKDSSWGEVK